MADEKVTQEDDKLEPEQKEEPIKIPEFPYEEFQELFDLGNSTETGGLPIPVPGVTDTGSYFEMKLETFCAEGFPFPTASDMTDMMADAYQTFDVKIIWPETWAFPSPMLAESDSQGFNWEKAQAMVSLKSQQFFAVCLALIEYLGDWLKLGLDVLKSMVPKIVGTAITIWDLATKTAKELWAMLPSKDDESEEGKSFWKWLGEFILDPVIAGIVDWGKEQLKIWKAIMVEYGKMIIKFCEDLVAMVTDILEAIDMLKMPSIPTIQEIKDMFNQMFPEEEGKEFNWKDYIPDWKEYLPEWPTCEQVTIAIPGIPPYSEMRKMKPDLPEECSYDSMKAFFFNDSDEDDQSWWDKLKAKWPDSPWAKIKAFFGFGDEDEEDDEPFDWRDYIPDDLSWDDVLALIPDFPYTMEELEQMYEDFPSFADMRKWTADQFKALFWAIPEQSGDSSWRDILTDIGVPDPFVPWLMNQAEEFFDYCMELMEALAQACLDFIIKFVADLIGMLAIPKICLTVPVIKIDVKTPMEQLHSYFPIGGGGENDTPIEEVPAITPVAEPVDDKEFEEVDEPVELAA